jgi:hypothetical protein
VRAAYGREVESPFPTRPVHRACRSHRYPAEAEIVGDDHWGDILGFFCSGCSHVEPAVECAQCGEAVPLSTTQKLAGHWLYCEVCFAAHGRRQ